MTISTSPYFPDIKKELLSQDEGVKANGLMRMFNAWRDSYRDLAQQSNGSLGTWDPVVLGMTTAGVGTYTVQCGTYFKYDTIADYWFNVEWSAHTGTGNLAITVPHIFSFKGCELWVNPLQTSGIAYPAGCTMAWANGINNTFNALVTFTGSGVAAANLAVPATGSIHGHLRYLSQQVSNA